MPLLLSEGNTMPTIEEVISKLKENDEEAAGVVSKLLEEKENFKTQSRRWEDQSKANREDAEKFRKGQSGVADLEKQLEALRSEKSALEKTVEEKDTKISEFQQEKDRVAMLSDVAGEKGIPSHLHGYLQGSTKEELEASAEKLKRDFKFGEVDGFGNDQKLPSKGTLEDGKALYEDYQKN